MLLPLMLAAAHVLLADAAELVPVTEDLVVTGSRTAATRDPARAVTVLDAHDVAAAPVTSVAELLSYAAGVDLRARGVQGVSADVSLRGASFEETLVLLDGVKVVDPQTGHQTLDLPVTLADIERIEILRGSAARVYGPNAFGGVINVITRRPQADGASFTMVGGENQLTSALVSATSGSELGGVRVSVAPASNDGYRHNTASQQLVTSLAAMRAVAGGEVDFSAGFAGKQFGANGFYVNGFPEAWEQTSVGYAAARGAWRLGEVTLEPRLSYRRHTDDFLLIHDNPAFYDNQHTTESLGAELQATVATPFGVTAVVGELDTESIDSNSLGNHRRERGGLLLEQRFPTLWGVELVGGAAVYGHSGFGVGVYPGADLSVALGSSVRLYASVNEGYRIPTFTELYYGLQDKENGKPVTNLGDPNLHAERAWTYETGLGWRTEGLQARASVFYRQGRDLIDWQRAISTDPWQATNLGTLDTKGLELEAVLSPRELVPGLPVDRLRLAYAWLSSSGATSVMQSKYVLDYLRHEATVELTHPWPLGAHQSWIVRVQDRVGTSVTVLVDARLAWRTGAAELFLEGTNLGNASYQGAGFVPMPGRWLSAGVRVETGG